jgi:hypothetical protein
MKIRNLNDKEIIQNYKKILIKINRNENVLKHKQLRVGFRLLLLLHGLKH